MSIQTIAARNGFEEFYGLPEAEKRAIRAAVEIAAAAPATSETSVGRTSGGIHTTQAAVVDGVHVWLKTSYALGSRKVQGRSLHFDGGGQVFGIR